MKTLIQKSSNLIVILITIISSSIVSAQVDNALDVTGTGQVHGKFISDSLHIKKIIEIGNSLWLGTTQYSPAEQIFSDIGPLMIQSDSASSSLNTIINGLNNSGNVGIGTTAGNSPHFKLDVDSGYINITKPTFGYCIGGISSTIPNEVLKYHGASGSTPSTTNIFVGVGAGNANTTGLYNTAVGSGALYNAATANDEKITAIGCDALYNANNTASGGSNSGDITAVGYRSLYKLHYNGFQNTAIGGHALYNCVSNGSISDTGGTENTALGAYALVNNTIGRRNTGVGDDVLHDDSTGNFNSALGSEAGWNKTNNYSIGDYNTFIGADAGVGLSNLNNASAIGARAYVKAHNSMVLGSIKGKNGADTTINVGIGTPEPHSRLHLNEPTINNPVYAQWTDSLTGANDANGFKVGIAANGTAELRQQENKNMSFFTSNFEHFRITAGAIPSALHPDSGAVIQTNNLAHFTISNWVADTGVGAFNPHTVLRVIGDDTLDGPGNIIPVAEFRRTDSSGQETAIKIRGQRHTLVANSNPPANSASILLSNYDKDETIPAYDMAKIAAGMDSSAGKTGNISFWTNGGTGTAGLQERVRITHMGNVGIDTIFPNNALEIRSYSFNPYYYSPAGSSGLRFSNMKASTNALINHGAGVLSVDSAGNVIYVANISTFGLPCSSSPGWDLSENWRVGLGAHNLYYANGHDSAFRNSLGIGYECGDLLLGKLSVNEISQNHPSFFSIAGYFHNTSNAELSIGLYGKVENDATWSIGVAGVVQGDPTGFNWGIYGESIPHDTAIQTTHNWAGFFNGALYASSIYPPSDSLLKEDISPISNSLKIIDSLKPHGFYFDTAFANSKGLYLPRNKQYGFIAQDVEKILPELVTTATKPPQFDTLGRETHPAFTFKALNYNAFIGILTQGVKDLDSITTNLSNHVDSIKVAANNGVTIDSSGKIQLGGDLIKETQINLNNTDILFSDASSLVFRHNKVAIGHNAPLNSKFSVCDTTEQIAGYFSSSYPIYHGVDYGIYAAAIGSYENTGGYFTASNASNYNFGVYGKAPAPDSASGPVNAAGYFEGDLAYTGSLYHASDSILKQNIAPITHAMDIINQLKPKTFDFKISQYPYLSLPAGINYGLIAQDVENILPSIITMNMHPEEKDTAGNIISPELKYKGLNYTELIPILVQAVKEVNAKSDSVTSALQQKIDSLRQVINSYESRFENIESRLNNCCGDNEKSYIPPAGNSTDVELDNRNSIVLNQNVPNPFAENTTISYYIPESSLNAQIIFTDNYGRIIKTVDLTIKGSGQLKVFADNLSTGVYTYSLVIDGKTIDSKKMVRMK